MHPAPLSQFSNREFRTPPITADLLDNSIREPDLFTGPPSRKRVQRGESELGGAKIRADTPHHPSAATGCLSRGRNS